MLRGRTSKQSKNLALTAMFTVVIGYTLVRPTKMVYKIILPAPDHQKAISGLCHIQTTSPSPALSVGYGTTCKAINKCLLSGIQTIQRQLTTRIKILNAKLPKNTFLV